MKPPVAGVPCQGRFACAAHVTSGSCSNSRTIRREELEARVLAGLKDRIMTPEAAEAAMRAYAEETNRLNRERRASGETDRAELARIDKAMKEIVQAIEDGGYTRTLTDRLRELEIREDDLRARLAAEPEPLPDIHPNAAHIYRRKVERLAGALSHPDDRLEAAEALRGLIERVVLTPGPKRGQLDATLYGKLGTILDWIARQGTGSAAKKNASGTDRSRVSVSVLAGARDRPAALEYWVRDSIAGKTGHRVTDGVRQPRRSCKGFASARQRPPSIGCSREGERPE